MVSAAVFDVDSGDSQLPQLRGEFVGLRAESDSMSMVTGTGSRASLVARSRVSRNVADAASGRPVAAATPRLVVPMAGKPACTSAAADAQSHAFGKIGGPSR